jgi:hypothetical protein
MSPSAQRVFVGLRDADFMPLGEMTPVMAGRIQIAYH